MRYRDDEWYGSEVAGFCRRYDIPTRTRHILAGHDYQRVSALREDVLSGAFMRKRRVGLMTYHEVTRALILRAQRMAAGE